MSQKTKTLVLLLALVIVIAGAAIAYNALKKNVSPDISLAEQPGSISSAQAEAPAQDVEEEPKQDEEAQEKTKAPDFTMEDADGKSVKLSDIIGKPIVLNFWASWCPPCKAEMPEFNVVYEELKDDVNFMMVNMTDGQRETKEKGAEYVSEQGFTFPVYYDVNLEGATIYGIYSIPTTLFIDAEGYIVAGAEGQIDESTLRYGIELIRE